MPWQGEQFIALVGPARVSRPPRAAEINNCLRDLAERRVASAITPALSPKEAEPFEQAGFRLHERLHLLARPLDEPPPRVDQRIRKGRPWNQRRVLELDGKAFEHFWRFDATSLREARRATPTNRFVVAAPGRTLAGYAVTGRAGSRGYLQRLAVDPEFQGAGIGAALVNDCLSWLHRKGAGMALVNTQERNVRALELYERLGFVRQREGLIVLRWDNMT